MCDLTFLTNCAVGTDKQTQQTQKDIVIGVVSDADREVIIIHKHIVSHNE